MILVAGSRCAGTSLWMEILTGGGFPPAWGAFPRSGDGAEVAAALRAQHEPRLAGGIWWRTNPDPATGYWLHPKAVEHHAVRVFPRGLARTEYAYVTRVIATVRDWRAYEAEARPRFLLPATDTEAERSLPMPPGFEWWLENYELIRDIGARRYGIHVLSHAALLADPEGTIRKVFGWIGMGEADKAWFAAREAIEAREEQEPPAYASEFAGVFDEFYQRIHTGGPLDGPFIEKLNETNTAIFQTIRQLAPDYLRLRERIDALDPPGMPPLPEGGISQADAAATG
ncbi:MAG: hypothetical protein IID61_05690 [SAR324 cluster bacterium]|nr:hypothetical protein [SAR324 cluster bacterium]